MFLRRFIRKNKIFIVAVFIASAPGPGRAADKELTTAINDLVSELKDREILAGSGYNAQKTDLAAALGITQDDVDQFLENMAQTSRNSSSLVESVKGLSVEVKRLSSEIGNLKEKNASHTVSIERNLQDIRDNRHFFGWFVVVLGSCGGYLHRWLHRKDKEDNKDG